MGKQSKIFAPLTDLVDETAINNAHEFIHRYHLSGQVNTTQYSQMIIELI